MAVIVFSKPVALPIAPLRDQLKRHLPLFKWQIGEDDAGAEKQMGAFRETGVIMGRSDATTIFTEYRCTLGRFPDAPPHEWYLEYFAPTTELKPVADRLTLILCMVSMILDEAAAHCQLRPGGPWLTPPDLLRVFKAVLNGEDLAIADGLGIPPAHFADAPPTRPTAPRAADQDFRDGRRVLPHLAVLLDRPVRWQPDELLGFVRELDADGDWRATRTEGGQAVLVGRDAVVGILDIAEPLPEGMLADGWTRSFWFQGDRAAIERHRRHLCITSTLDTAAADWVTVRQVAKVMTLAAAWLARLPGALALHNTGPGITFAATEASRFLSILARDQLPVMLWSWTRPQSVEDGDVTLSTSGLEPFLGHEIEVWNAPLSCDEVGEKMSDLIVYLLDHGAVIGHGDSAGQTRGDRAIRCFLGPSRAARPQPVQALFLEFEAPGAAAPRPDLPAAPEPPMSAASESVLRDFVATVGGRDTTGMSDVIRGMLAKNEAARDAVRIVADKPLTPDLAEADRLLAQLKRDADGTSAEAIEAMRAALRDPPSPEMIASDANPFHVNLMKMIHHEQATGALPRPIPAPPPPPPPAAFGRRVGGFGRKGL